MVFSSRVAWHFSTMTTVPICTGPILESGGMRAIFQKKDKKGQNIWKFGQKCTRFGKYFEIGQPQACDYRMHETARIYPDISQFNEWIIMVLHSDRQRRKEDSNPQVFLWEVHLYYQMSSFMLKQALNET